MKTIYDVAIAGGGPAGSMAAITLARQHKKVILLEASDYSGTRIGETISPSVTAFLRKQGLWSRFEASGQLPCWGNRSAWGTGEIQESSFIFSPYGTGWHLDRSGFDKMIFEAAIDSGVTGLIQSKVTDIDFNGLYELEIKDPGNFSYKINARFFLNATGRDTRLIRKLGGRKTICCPLVANCARYIVPMQPKNNTLVESVPDGWWYSAPVPGDRLVVVYFTDAAGSRRLARIGWEACLNQARHTMERTGGGSKTEEPRMFGASSHRLSKNDWDIPWLSCGDALMAVDPLSSGGIQHALESGYEAANAICEWLSGNAQAAKEYEKKSGDSYLSYLALRESYYAMEKRWLSSEFWKNQTQNKKVHPNPVIENLSNL